MRSDPIRTPSDRIGLPIRPDPSPIPIRTRLLLRPAQAAAPAQEGARRRRRRPSSLGRERSSPGAFCGGDLDARTGACGCAWGAGEGRPEGFPGAHREGGASRAHHEGRPGLGGAAGEGRWASWAGVSTQLAAHAAQSLAGAAGALPASAIGPPRTRCCSSARGGAASSSRAASSGGAASSSQRRGAREAPRARGAPRSVPRLSTGWASRC